MKNKRIIQNESGIKQLFKKHYQELFPGYSIYKEEFKIKYQKKHGFIDFILKHNKDEKFILIEFKYNKTDEASIKQINKYFKYLKIKGSLKKKDAQKYLIDYQISKESKELCKENNIKYLCLKEIPFFKNITFKKEKTEAAKQKVKLTFSINRKTAEEFKKLCEEEGWKLGKQIEKYMTEVLRSR